MVILLRKAYRSIMRNKKAYLACILLISLGISLYIAMNRSFYGLSTSAENFYRTCHLADAFAKVKGMPDADIKTIQTIPGVLDAQTRIVYDARVLTGTTDKMITLRLISYDDTVPDEIRLNDFKRTGSPFSSSNQIVVGSGFFTAHHLQVGDTLPLLIKGKVYDFSVIGTAMSPEFVYTIKDNTEMLPDTESFDIGFVQKEDLALMTGMTGLSNDVSVTFKEGYTFDDLKVAIEDALRPYGILSFIKQDDQPSKNMLDTEIKSIKSYATTMPTLFIGISVVILYIMLKRVIEQERMEIGTLKAFGYSNFVVLLHYLGYGLMIGVLGGLVGIVMGYYLSGYMLTIYATFFNIPDIAASFSYRFLVYGMIISVFFGCIGAFAGAFGITRLKPADAMRPAAPPLIKTDWIKHLNILKVFLTMGGFITLRSIARNKFRSLVVVFSISISFALMAFMGSYNVMMDAMMLDLFSKVQLYDLKITLDTPVAYRDGIESIILLKDATLTEGLLEIPVVLKHNHLQTGMMLTGIEPQSALYKIYDNDKGTNLPPPTHGVILSNKVADDLAVTKGDSIVISTPLLKEEPKVIVTDVVTQNFGSGCYIELGSLSDLFHIERSVSAIVCKTDNAPQIITELLNGKNIAGLDDKTTTKKRYDDMMGSYRFMIYFVFLMSVVVAFAIIYNTSTISLSERKREYATLRVLGLHASEVADILSFEYWILCLFGIGFGVPLTMLMKEGLRNSIDMSTFTFPTSTPLYSYMLAALGCILSVLLANQSAKKAIRRFDLVDVLKERE